MIKKLLYRNIKTKIINILNFDCFDYYITLFGETFWRDGERWGQVLQ